MWLLTAGGQESLSQIVVKIEMIVIADRKVMTDGAVVKVETDV